MANPDGTVNRGTATSVLHWLQSSSVSGMFSSQSHPIVLRTGRLMTSIDAASPTEYPPTPAVILAGGLARRIGGGDKPTREIGVQTILARVIARLAPQCDGL